MNKNKNQLIIRRILCFILSFVMVLSTPVLFAKADTQPSNVLEYQFYKTCTNCSGRGYITVTRWHTCGNCGGSGYASRTYSSHNWVHDHDGNNESNGYGFGNDVCGWCREDLGFVDPGQHYEYCSRCGATGIWAVDAWCPHCGKQINWAGDTRPSGPCSTTSTCSTCDGDGGWYYDDTETCSVCGGSKKLHQGNLKISTSNQYYGKIIASRTSGEVLNGTVTFTAQSAAGCKFEGWYKGNNLISTNVQITSSSFGLSAGSTSNVTAKFVPNPDEIYFTPYKSEDTLTQGLISAKSNLIISNFDKLIYLNAPYIPIGTKASAHITPTFTVVESPTTDKVISNVILMYSDFKEMGSTGYMVRYNGLNLKTDNIVTQKVYKSQLISAASGTTVYETWNYNGIDIKEDAISTISLNVFRCMWKLPKLTAIKLSDLTPAMTYPYDHKDFSRNGVSGYEMRDTIIRSNELPYLTNAYVKVTFNIEVYDDKGNLVEYNDIYEPIVVYYPLAQGNEISYGY